MNNTRIEQWFYTWNRSSFDILVPNFTPLKWFECDILGITKSGYSVEYEIKRSRSDFFADFKKEKRIIDTNAPDDGIKRPFPGMFPKMKTILKHDLLEQKSDRGPNRFFYVVPRDLIKPEEIPEYAGLFFFSEKEKQIRIELIKEAPKLHRSKFPEKDMNRILKNVYFRYWGARRALLEEKV